MIVASAEGAKNLFLPAHFSETLFFRTTHVPRKLNDVIVIATIGVKHATHSICPQLMDSCMKRIICSCKKKLKFEKITSEKLCKYWLLPCFSSFLMERTQDLLILRRNDWWVFLFEASLFYLDSWKVRLCSFVCRFFLCASVLESANTCEINQNS